MYLSSRVQSAIVLARRNANNINWYFAEVISGNKNKFTIPIIFQRYIFLREKYVPVYIEVPLTWRSGHR